MQTLRPGARRLFWKFIYFEFVFSFWRYVWCIFIGTAEAQDSDTEDRRPTRPLYVRLHSTEHEQKQRKEAPIIIPKKYNEHFATLTDLRLRLIFISSNVVKLRYRVPLACTCAMKGF